MLNIGKSCVQKLLPSQIASTFFVNLHSFFQYFYVKSWTSIKQHRDRMSFILHFIKEKRHDRRQTDIKMLNISSWYI